MYRPISDYALVGDCHSAALIASDGAIDWFCAPRFDSPALFLRLLDDARGGYCALRFNTHVGTSRGYLPRTNILETCFQAHDGQLTVTDFMPIRPSSQLNDEGQDVLADHRIVRMLCCTAGEVEFDVEIKPTFDFAREVAEFVVENDDVVLARGRHQALCIQLEGQRLRPDANGAVAAHVMLRAGETARLSLTVGRNDQRMSPVSSRVLAAALDETRRYWEQWSATCTYEGEFAELVLRSALALKLMTYEPTGAIIAAPTTSLPEAIGGARNWDYRFCWVRDATFTLISLMNLGYFGEARDFLHFLKRTVRNGERFQVLYRLDGGREAEECDFDHLAGYRHSRPVRVGNAAAHQQQLDIFGELVHCIYLYTAHPETSLSAEHFRSEFWPIVRGAADYVAEHWREPDKGIWELRGEPRQFVYSKGACWLALDRAIRLAQHAGCRAEIETWSRERQALLHSFEHFGFNPEVGAFVQSYGARALDASILRLPIMGVLDANDPKMLATIERIEDNLMRGGLVYRYRHEDGLPGDEGAFAACGFWLVDNYVLCGRLKDARNLFRHLASFANDVGLISEEIDPESGSLLGNFPQAFTHIALINAALRLAQARLGRKPAAHRVAEEELKLPPFQRAA